MQRNVFSLLALASLASLIGCAASGSSDDGSGDDRVSESVRCAAGSTVQGIDVSAWQGNVDWHAVKASGHGFAVARISDGSFHDKYFAANWAGMKSAGLVRGAYQYFEPGQDVAMQADMVVAAVGKLGDGDLPVTLDVEATGGQSAATIAARIGQWAARVQSGTGKTPTIYTGKYFWNDNVKSNAYAGNALWIAAYGPKCPDLPSPWTNWKFFQYSDKGSVPGVSGGVDSDVFNGTLAELHAFAGGGSSGGGTTPPPPPPPPPNGCYSHTLGAEVPTNTCVQSRADSKWYQCAGDNNWVDRFSDPAACTSVHPL